LAVDNIDEGLELRKAKVIAPILVFGYPELELIDKAVENDLTLTVYDRDTLRMISKSGILLKKPVKVHVKVETGMNRYGVMPFELMEFMNYLKHTPKIELEGLYSHFASAQSRDKSYTFHQLGIFQKVTEDLKKAGYNIPLIHIANSAAALSIPSSQLDMVRLGICLYGLFPTPELGTFFDLLPALEWKSKIVSLKRIAGSEKVGYDGSYTTNGAIMIAVVPVGYADGYDRNLSNYAKVLVNGQRANVIGKICMRAFMIDVSNIENVKVGDEVILIGKQGEEQITAGELSGLLGTINYEVVSRISPALPRVYVK
jgi:alanine racemase